MTDPQPASSRSRHLVDPELLALVDMTPTAIITPETLTELRAAATRMPIDPVMAGLTKTERRQVPGPADAPDVGLLIHRPAAATDPLPCILHIHGGGFNAGDAASMEGLNLPAAVELGCCIVSVDYRIAPETRFPGAVEDCYAALGWLLRHAGEIGVDPDRIGVKGESAGGGLAAALALLARDRGEHRLAFQHLIYPMLDDRTGSTASEHPYAGEFFWTAHNNWFGWSALLGGPPGEGEVSPYAAPARAQSLAGLPPSYIATGALDLFLEEDLEYARRLIRDGVATELHVYPGAYHGFDMLDDVAVAQACRRDSHAALRRALHPGDRD